MIYDCCMRKKTAKKNNTNKRGNKNVDSWGLRMVKNVGGALPLVGLLVGGAALAGGAVAVSKMSNAEEDGLDRDEDFERTLQEITLNNTPSITSPSPSANASTNTRTNTQTSRNDGVGARTGGLQNQTQAGTSTGRIRSGNNSEITARIRSQVSDIMMNEPMDNFESGLSINQITNIQRMMIRSFNMNAERKNREERLDDTFADGIIGPSTRALIYILKRASLTGGNLNSHLDPSFIEQLSRHTGMFTGNSQGFGTIKTVSRKRRLR